MYCYSLATGSFQSWIVLLQDASTIQQSEEFTNDPDVQAMASQQGFNSDNKSIFFRVFQKWGTHYIDQVIIGGSFNYFVSVDSSYSSDLTSIEANLNLEYKALFVDAKAQSSADWTTLGKEWVSRRQSSWTATGGNTAMLKAINAQPTYGDSDSGAFSAWVDSIATSPAMIGFHLSDMSTLFSGTVQDAMLAALNAYINEGIFVSADFTVMSNSDIPINPSGTISCSGVTFPNPAPTPAPDPSCWGGAQLVVLDPINLEPILNVGNYTPADGASLWDPFIDAVATLDVKDYFVALSVFGVCVEAAPPGGYPPASFVTWLESCGASLADWRNASTVNCAEDYATSYVFIGQCGLTPGNGIEKFTWDYVPPGKIIGGDYYANAMAPLIPAINGGPYIIRAVQR
jgi:hypothetical protein